ncbi:MAG: M14 family metallopeptidase [Cyclobacteriaceae bacterium]
MIQRLLLLTTMVVFFTSSTFAQLQSPEQFHGYALGDQFTRHHQVVDYYNHVAEQVPHIQLMEYGRTYEDRPLLLAVLSSPENMQNIETIREDNLKRAGLMDGDPTTNIPIIWLSYNVHGNESVSTEASMATIYELLTNRKEWLENAVVMIDPCINPDGRERYVNYYWQYGNQPYNPDPQAMELNEVWPRGRANHYLFDLNRDWAWQSQIESQHRIKQYNKWLPQVHVDFHEQGVNNPYYFAPAARPYHELITQWQRDFQVTIGKNHAKYFDQENWFYFTKQRFDLLYPSYGDTYPTYSGAIGMTYEQGGSGRAGLGVITQEGDTLTLKDRIAHHYTTGISTVETAVANRDQMLSEFKKFYDNGLNNPTGNYKSFVIKAGDDPTRTEDLKNWLGIQGIQYGTSSSSKGLSGYRYSTKSNQNFSIDQEDIVISAYQPKSVLTQILMEPQTMVEDSLTYDITAWSIPYAFGLEAYATKTRLAVTTSDDAASFVANETPDNAYAFLLEWKNLKDARLLSALLKADVKTRFSEQPFTYSGKRYNPGTIVVAKRDNAHLGSGFEDLVVGLANEHQRRLFIIQTGFADAGPDLGSSDIAFLNKPKVALLGGDGSSSLDFGATWHFFEQQLGYPVTVLGTHYFGGVDLSPYDVLILQSGDYGTIGDKGWKKIQSWVENGGKLIAVQDAVKTLHGTEFTSLSGHGNDEEKNELDKMKAEISEKRQTLKYGNRERERAKEIVPGAIFRVTLDNTHPLAFGYGDSYFSLKTDNHRFGYLDKGWNVGIIDSNDDHMAGFAGQYVKRAATNSMVFGTESVGQGQIVYMVDNPLFRAFWYDGKLLFCNAVFFVGQ